MAGKEDKEKAEKLAAAKKRVAQLQKAKKKAGGPVAGGERPSAQTVNDEHPKSPKKKYTLDDGSDEAEEPKVDERTKEGDATPELGQDRKTLGDAIVTLQPGNAGLENPESPQSITGAQDRPGESFQDSGTLPKMRSDTHDGQPSLSAQSKLRSDSFRRTSTVGPLSPSTMASALPPLSPTDDRMSDIYRRQALRVEELESENKKLEREAKESESRSRRSEEELEELREASGEASAVKFQSKRLEQSQQENTKLQAEIAALQRQLQQRGHSQSVSRSMRSASLSDPSLGSPDSVKRELESKASTIADMELEISRLQKELSTKTSSCETHGSEISGLRESLRTTRDRVGNVEAELADSKRALQRASEKAVKDGVERTSHDTRMKALERELADASAARDETMRKAENLDKKIATMSKLHREAEARSASKLSATESQGREANALKARLAAIENEDIRAREERDRRKRREASGVDDDGLDELEDEERSQLEARVRELEGEVFDLKRGLWRERRKEMQPNPEHGDDGMPSMDNDGDFDEVDLSGGGFGSGKRYPGAQPSQPKHSSFSTVLNSGLAAFRGSGEHSTRPRQDSLAQELDDDDAFDQEAFAIAQREEEAKKMVERAREIKQKLRDWQGWRLDLVDARRSAAGMQEAGLGEIFEV